MSYCVENTQRFQFSYEFCPCLCAVFLQSIDEFGNDLVFNLVEEFRASLVSQIAYVMQEVIDGLNQLAQGAEASSKNSVQQAEMMEQLELGVEQISEVVQGNSAIAQEVAATSEELSAQAISLDNMVGQFKL